MVFPFPKGNLNSHTKEENRAHIPGGPHMIRPRLENEFVHQWVRDGGGRISDYLPRDREGFVEILGVEETVNILLQTRLEFLL